MTLVRPPGSEAVRGSGVAVLLGSKRAQLVALGAIVALAVLVWQWGPFTEWLDLPYLKLRIVRIWKTYLPLNAIVIGSLAICFILERIIPARPRSETGGRGFCEDLLWFLLATPVAVMTGFWLGRLMTWVFEYPLADVRIDLDSIMPYGVAFVFCFILGDFLGWLSHVIRHKVPLFWRFHAVHHSAMDLSALTDARVHFMESLIVQMIAVLPFFFLGGDVTQAVALALGLRLAYARFIHANIRTHLGPLEHVFNTPQYHRMHHSLEPGDVDKNFAGMFTIWDRLFGMMCTDYERYPRTGIHDPNFPHAADRKPTTIFVTYLKQNLYPFLHNEPRELTAPEPRRS